MLFCLFGFPLILFFTWQLIRRRRKRERREYRSRLQRKRQKLAVIASSVGKRPGYSAGANTITRSLTSESPQTSYSQRNDTTPTSSSSKEHQYQSAAGSIGGHEKHAEHGDTMRTTFETNETDLSAINAPTYAVVHKLPQSVPATPNPNPTHHSYVEYNYAPTASPTTNSRPRRVRSVLKPSPIPVTLDHRPSSSTLHFPEGNHVKIESPKFDSSQPRMSVRRTQSSVSNKDGSGRPKTRMVLNRASTWLGSTRPASPVIGCFSRNSFRRKDQTEPSPGNRSIKLTRLRKSNDLTSGSSTSSSSTMSEQADVFFGSDSPTFSYPSPPDSAARPLNSTHQDYAPSPYIAPDRVSIPRDVPIPSPTRTHHFIHLNRPLSNTRSQAVNTNQTNGYEIRNNLHHGSIISKTDAETDPAVSMCDSQTPLLAVHRNDLMDASSTAPVTAATIPDLSRLSIISSDMSTRSGHAFEPVTSRVQFTGAAEQAPVEKEYEGSNNVRERKERVIVIDMSKPRPKSQQSEQQTLAGIEWDEEVADKTAEITLTWPRSTRQTTAEPVIVTPLSPSNSVTSQPSCS